jgi:hypothetical protein
MIVAYAAVVPKRASAIKLNHDVPCRCSLSMMLNIAAESPRLGPTRSCAPPSPNEFSLYPESPAVSAGRRLEWNWGSFTSVWITMVNGVVE